MLMLGGLVIVVLLALLVWDLAGQPTGRRWRRRRRRRAAASGGKPPGP
ncbi:MAG: hypothetical protein Q8S03_10385 [Brevundimonas sp.]|nr:hypothetical protein [Brevundimonas sp.]MBX9615411.1 hypothetical protein [Caulobacteraceae bacterium]MDP3405087.1 hypothetical protein [Brevundimonas sp.]